MRPDPNILDYAGARGEAPDPVRPAAGRTAVWCCAALALVALHTCVWIEVLNARAGFYLPRDLSTDPGKWRSSYAVSEDAWRQREAMFRQDRTLLTRPLSPAETATMRSDVAQARQWNRLRDWVSGPGLLQYLLVPLVLLQSMHLLGHPRADNRHRIGWATLAAALACGASMLYRGYFTSLGY